MRRAVLVLAVLLAGCATMPRAVRPFNAQPFAPPEWFRFVHRDMLACLEEHGGEIKSRDFGAINWYVARPGVMGEMGEVPPWTGEVGGLWSWPHDIIMDARYVIYYHVAAHEMGHEMLESGNEAHALIALCDSAPPSPR